mgnify:CR=1 FL=1
MPLSNIITKLKCSTPHHVFFLSHEVAFQTFEIKKNKIQNKHIPHFYQSYLYVYIYTGLPFVSLKKCTYSTDRS